MNHKRHKAKNQRGGCLMCHPHKMNGFGKESQEWEKFADHKKRKFAKEELQNTEHILNDEMFGEEFLSTYGELK